MHLSTVNAPHGMLKVVLFVGLILFSSCISIFFLHNPAQAASQADARAFANSFCPQGPNPEMKIADYMWITNRNGGTNISALQGQTSVPITIHFYVTYCRFWGNFNDGATNLRVYERTGNTRQRLTNQPANISYGGTAIWGQRSTWGTSSYNARLDIRGWGTGRHAVCNSFRTTTNKPGVILIDSPSACLTLNLTRTARWALNATTYSSVNSNNPTANPTGGGYTTSNKTAVPGDVIYFASRVRNSNGANSGITPTLRQGRDRIVKNIDGSRISCPTNYTWNAGFSGCYWEGGRGNTRLSKGETDYYTQSAGARSFRTIQPSDAGRRFCERYYISQTSYNNAGALRTAWRCINVPYNYNLTPTVSGPNGMGVAGAPIPVVRGLINNALTGGASGTTTSRSAQWQLKRIEIAPGGSIPTTQQQNGAAPCNHYNNGGQNACIDKGSGTRTFPPGSITVRALNNETIDPATLAGTKICYTLSVQPYSDNSPNWRHSAPVCLTVSKQPKMQVWGNDVHTRGQIETGISTVNAGGADRVFGSWVEYGGFSVGANEGFASGAALNEGSANTTATDSWHELTFANVDDSGAGSYGVYTLPADLPSLTSQFIGSPSAGAINSNLGSLESGTYTTGNFTINASNVGQSAGKGKSIIIVSSGTVTINGNIMYQGPGGTDTFTDADQLPQVIIIARNINIRNAATQVDAWLLTTGDGHINTCSDVALSAPLTTAVCDQQLTVNGPVATQHLHLRRTAGSDNVADAGRPAEIFNLRPDAYIWAYGRASQSGKAQTVYSVELPPRF
ncbi:MAG TPA: hypothetical protein VFM68_04160 [Candidatus Saccharimonadales bacterium]|nr:hypothetical protein [Candidatus Saccharimonadales bacterium]